MCFHSNVYSANRKKGLSPKVVIRVGCIGKMINRVDAVKHNKIKCTSFLPSIYKGKVIFNKQRDLET